MKPSYSSPRELFLACLDLSSAEQREALLETVESEAPEWVDEARILLKAHDEAEGGGFLGTDPGWVDQDEKLATSLERIGVGVVSRVGRYKLLEKIGEGGMGVVYMAEQEEPVRRRVALKIIKLGMDTKEVVARFEAERQALAMMDNPHIAKLLDAGATESGRPYFVMELVRGLPITEFCDKNELSIRERLELLLPVCHAIQHAHQKGVIHRDIKPSNILVARDGEKPHPIVIDFGVAKATNQRLTEKTLFTRFANMIGTPAYMSPEQAEMSIHDVDTRSDIYSLGILLYELLTGTPPFSKERLGSAGYGEMQRIIKEEEPLRPSVVVSKRGTTGQSRSSSKSLDPAALSRVCKGDLDWIVLKAIAKDRSRRYATANELVADLKRHLNGEPVSAAAPSLFYHLQKLASRNKGAFIATAAVATSVLVGTTVSTWQAIRTNTLLEREKRLTSNLEAAVAAAEEAREEVDRRLYRSNLDRVQISLSNHEPGVRSTVDSLLKEAASLEVDIKDEAAMRNAAFASILQPYSSGGETVYRGAPLERFQNRVVAWNSSIMAVPFRDGSIQVMDKVTREVFDTLRSDRSRVRSLSFGGDGRTLLSTHEGLGGRIRLWRRNPAGKWLLQQEIPWSEDQDKTEVAVGTSGFVALSDESSNLKYWRRFSDPQPEVQELPEPYGVGFFRHVVISPDQRWAAIRILGTSKLLLWNLDEGEFLKEIALPFDGIVWMETSPDGRFFALGIGNFFRVYETGSFDLLFEKTGPGEGCEWFDFSSDSSMVVYGRRPAYLHHLQTNQQMGTFARNPVEQFAASESFKFGSQPGELVYEYPSGENEVTVERCRNLSPERIELMGHSKSASWISFHPTQPWATTTSLDHTLRFWDLESGTELRQIRSSKPLTGPALFSPDDSMLVLRFQDDQGSIQIRDSMSLNPLGLIEHGEPTTGASFSEDGALLCTLGKKHIRLWSNDSGASQESSSQKLMREVQIDQIVAHSSPPETLVDSRNIHSQVSPDGKYLAWVEAQEGSETHTLRLWDLFRESLLDNHFDFVGPADFAFTGNTTTIAVLNEQGSVAIWNYMTGKVESETKKLGRFLENIEVSDDGHFLAFSFRPNRIGLYDLMKQEIIATSPPLGGSVTTIHWSPDSSRLGVAKANGFSFVLNVDAVSHTFDELGIGW